VPVATVAIGNARNAGLLAVRILAAADDERGLALRARMRDFQAELNADRDREGRRLQASLHPPVSG